MLLISDFAGQHQTVGAALGQGWSVLGAVLVAVYTECFGAAYNSLGWFMGMLSIVMAVSIGAACYVAKESPLEKSMEKQSCCQNVTSAFGSILSAVRTLPKVLVVYCIVLFFIQYAYAAYNGNKGMFFGIEVFDGDAINAATCDEECSEEQRDYNRGVRLAGGVGRYTLLRGRVRVLVGSPSTRASLWRPARCNLRGNSSNVADGYGVLRCPCAGLSARSPSHHCARTKRL